MRLGVWTQQLMRRQVRCNESKAEYCWCLSAFFASTETFLFIVDWFIAARSTGNICWPTEQGWDKKTTWHYEYVLSEMVKSCRVVWNDGLAMSLAIKLKLTAEWGGYSYKFTRVDENVLLQIDNRTENNIIISLECKDFAQRRIEGSSWIPLPVSLMEYWLCFGLLTQWERYPLM